MVFQGAITADLFVEFMEERVLPFCSLYLGSESVLTLDNILIHKDVHLQQLCDNASILLKFLLLYSPDYNSIKAIFKDIKAWINPSIYFCVVGLNLNLALV